MRGSRAPAPAGSSDSRTAAATAAIAGDRLAYGYLDLRRVLQGVMAEGGQLPLECIDVAGERLAQGGGTGQAVGGAGGVAGLDGLAPLAEQPVHPQLPRALRVGGGVGGVGGERRVRGGRGGRAGEVFERVEPTPGIVRPARAGIDRQIGPPVLRGLVHQAEPLQRERAVVERRQVPGLGDGPRPRSGTRGPDCGCPAPDQWPCPSSAWGASVLAATGGARSLVDAAGMRPTNASARAAPSARAVRFYVASGLLDRPEGAGKTALFIKTRRRG